jgi:hypothetical protein
MSNFQAVPTRESTKQAAIEAVDCLAEESQKQTATQSNRSGVELPHWFKLQSLMEGCAALQLLDLHDFYFLIHY